LRAKSGPDDGWKRFTKTIEQGGSSVWKKKEDVSDQKSERCGVIKIVWARFKKHQVLWGSVFECERKEVKKEASTKGWE